MTTGNMYLETLKELLSKMVNKIKELEKRIEKLEGVKA